MDKKPRRVAFGAACRWRAGILVGLLALSGIVLGQSSSSRFQQPNPSQGLPNHAVLCFLEDQQGFLWIGTQDGLYRFDGYESKVYRANPLDSNSLSNGYVWDLHQTADGSIWAATFGGGLNRLDPVSGRFEQIRKAAGPKGLSSDRVFAIGEGPDGRLWLGTQNGLNGLDPVSGKVEVYGCVEEEEVQQDAGYIGSLCVDPQGGVWFAGTFGLGHFDPGTERLQRFQYPPFGEDLEDKKEPLGAGYALCRDGDAVLLMCRSGMLRIDPLNQDQSWLVKARSVQPDGKTPIMRTVLPKSKGGYWVGTNQGLLSLDPKAKRPNEQVPKNMEPASAAASMGAGQADEALLQVDWMRSSPEEAGSLPDPTIHAVCRTRDGVTWIGTQKGVAFMPQERMAFLGLGYAANGQGPVHPSLTALAEGPNGRIWMATYGGLSAWDAVEDAWTHWPAGASGSAGSHWRNPYLLSLLRSRDGSLWIGSRGGGVHRIPPEGGAPRPVDGLGFDWSRTSIHAIHEDRNGMLWLGTGGSGLLRFDPRSDSVRVWPPAAAGEGPSHPYVFAIHEDRHGNLWLGTATGGLNLFDRRRGRFHYFQYRPENPLSLSNDLVLQLYEDRQNRLWIATAGGLHRFVPALVPDMARTLQDIDVLNAQPWFLRYAAAEGFPSEVVYGILEHPVQNGLFWVSTGAGLARFEANSGRVDRTATRVDGLPADECMQNGFLQLSDGRMAFSTAAGAVLFHPDSIRPNPVPPKLALTEVLLYNEALPVQNEGAPTLGGKKPLTLAAQPSHLGALRLGWKHDVLSFRFAALHFSDPSNNRCRYRLLGYDRDWLEAGANRTATYTNLPGGHYTLEVMGQNADGIAAESTYRLPLVVQAPPWARWWAWGLYALSLLGLFYALLRWRVQTATRKLAYAAALEQARQEGQEEFRRQSAEDFHDEAGSSITKINLFAALAREEAQTLPAVTAYLERIEQHSQYLSHGMRDFLWALDPRHDSLYHTLERFVHFARSEGGLLGLELEAPELEEAWHAVHLSMPVRKAVLQGLKEAFHNAMKHAEASHLRLELQAPRPEPVRRKASPSQADPSASRSKTFEPAAQWTVLLHDNGKGFDPGASTKRTSEQADSTAHYGLSAQKARCHRAGVAWRIESAPGQGSTVSFGFCAEAR